MKVYAYPADHYGCGYYRLIWPAHVLRARGHDVTVRMPNERHELRGVIDNGRLVDVEVPSDADVIVLQRVTHRHLVDAIRLVRAKYGIAVVVDVDDDLSRIHPRNAAFTAMHPNLPGSHPDHSWQHTVSACDNATLVQVSTPALVRRYGARGQAMVLTNCVPEAFLTVEHVDSPVIGWAGAIHSHPDDLQAMGPAVARLVRDGFEFKIVGPQEDARVVLGLDDEPTATGVVAFEDWSTTLAAELGVGVAPLAPTQFNDAKSWLKLLEYAATGVACVASPSPEYTRLHREGVGLLAERPKDWYRQVKRVVTDAGLRTELSARGRETAARWTIERNAHRWWEVWTEAYNRQREDTPGLRDQTRPAGYVFGGLGT